MKPGRRAAFWILGGCLVAGVIGAVVWQGREPVYKGRTLSQWLLYDPPASLPRGGLDERNAAIRAIGTNGLPWLLTWAGYEMPWWQQQVNRFAMRRRIKSQLGGRAVALARISWMAIYAMGPEARSAIPTFSRMMTEKRSSETQRRAAMALGQIGPEALPALLTVLTNERAAARGQAAMSIGGMRGIGTNGGVAVSALLNCLQDTNFVFAGEAMTALGRLGIESTIVVPALTNELRHPSPYIRRHAAGALEKFSIAARSSAPALVGACEDPDVSVRHAATNALQAIAPEAIFAE